MDLTLRYSDFSTFSKQHTIDDHINQGLDIYSLASHIFEGITLRLPVRLVGVSLSNIKRGPFQLSLFKSWEKKKRLVEAMDKINDSYGEFTITYGKLLNCQKHSGVIPPSYQPKGIHQVDVE